MVRKPIYCDRCKKVIGEIEHDARIESDDPFSGDGVPLCRECGEKRDEERKTAMKHASGRLR